jgi:hypothetical protein
LLGLKKINEENL